MSRESSQKFVGRNRPPRVHIEYEVEKWGSEVTVRLPFVAGVLADLSGKADPPEEVPAEHGTARGSFEDRKFLEIDVDNFDQRMKAMKPRCSFQVPNTITGESNLSIDLTFETMDDFSPAAVARKVDGVRELLEAREQLKSLLSFMDGKTKAEDLISGLLNDEAMLRSLTARPNAVDDEVRQGSTSESEEG